MTDTIKTRPDGSIDTAHYMRIGRLARSQAAHDLARAVVPQQTSRSGATRSWLLPLVVLSAIAVSLPYLT